MTDTSRGRWSFSLRTAFVLMTMICFVLGWRAWSLSWIRARHKAIGSGLVSVVDEIVYFAGDLPRPPVRAPGGLWLFGEKGRDLLRVDPANLESVSRLFPEAEIAGLPPAASQPRETVFEQGIRCFVLQSPPNPQPVVNKAHERILKALDETTSFEFAATPLADVVDYFKDLHGIEIQIDYKALEDAGIDSDTPIIKTLRGIRLAAALEMLLAPLDCVYVIKDEVLLITTYEKARLHVSVQAYDCRWAADRIPKLIEMLSLGKSAGLPKNKNALADADSFEIVPAGQTIVARANALQHDAIEWQLIQSRHAGGQPELATQAADDTAAGDTNDAAANGSH